MQLKQLIGESRPKIDKQGRVFFPTKLKECLGEVFVLCRGVEKCLMIYSTEGWQQMGEKLNEMPFSKARNIQRFFYSSASECSVDKQGRLVIPQTLRKYAELNDNEEVVIIGSQNRAEIWNAKEWDKHNDENITPEDILEAMDELGF